MPLRIYDIWINWFLKKFTKDNELLLCLKTKVEKKFNLCFVVCGELSPHLSNDLPSSVIDIVSMLDR
jgi:hypothetical protein